MLQDIFSESQFSSFFFVGRPANEGGVRIRIPYVLSIFDILLVVLHLHELFHQFCPYPMPDRCNYFTERFNASRLIVITSPSLISLEGLTGWSLILILPDRQASVAWFRS